MKEAIKGDLDVGLVFDASAWKLFCDRIPHYKMYDWIDENARPDVCYATMKEKMRTRMGSTTNRTITNIMSVKLFTMNSSHNIRSRKWIRVVCTGTRTSNVTRKLY